MINKNFKKKTNINTIIFKYFNYLNLCIYKFIKKKELNY